MAHTYAARIFLTAALFLPALAMADTVPASAPLLGRAKCLTAPKGYLQATLAKKLENDLAKSGLLNPKVRLKLREIANPTPDPATLDMAEVFKDTAYTVTDVQCIAAPCPPSIAFSADSSAQLSTCTVRFQADSKYTYAILEPGTDTTRPKKSRFSGSSSGQLAIPGILAPVGPAK